MWPSNDVPVKIVRRKNRLNNQIFNFQLYFFNVFLVSTLQMFTGDLRGSRKVSLQYLWKRAVTITEKPYTPHWERLCILQGNPTETP